MRMQLLGTDVAVVYVGFYAYKTHTKSRKTRKGRGIQPYNPDKQTNKQTKPGHLDAQP